jgi:hypothetical protein
VTRRLLILAVASAFLSASCGTDGLAFRDDERISFVTPLDRAQVRLPVELRWESALAAPGDGGPYFVVFVDREPMRPGNTIATVVDESCRRDPNCPDLDYLKDRGIYLVDTPDVRLETIPDRRSGNRTGAKESHEAVVVLVDGDGRRIDEAAWSLDFTVERDR